MAASGIRLTCSLREPLPPALPIRSSQKCGHVRRARPSLSKSSGRCLCGAKDLPRLKPDSGGPPKLLEKPPPKEGARWNSGSPLSNSPLCALAGSLAEEKPRVFTHSFIHSRRRVSRRDRVPVQSGTCPSLCVYFCACVRWRVVCVCPALLSSVLRKLENKKMRKKEIKDTEGRREG